MWVQRSLPGFGLVWVKMETGKGWRKLEHKLPAAERWMSMGLTYSCSKFRRPPPNPRRHPENNGQLRSFSVVQGNPILWHITNISKTHLTSVSSVVDTASVLVVVDGVVVVVVLSFFFLLFFFFVVSSSTFSVVASFSSASSFLGGDPEGLFKMWNYKERETHLGGIESPSPGIEDPPLDGDPPLFSTQQRMLLLGHCTCNQENVKFSDFFFFIFSDAPLPGRCHT